VAKIVCPKCKHQFDNNNPGSFVTRGSAATAGGVVGGIIGSRLGIVGGPMGAVNGMWIGAVVGGGAGWFMADQFRRCPECGHIFKT